MKIAINRCVKKRSRALAEPQMKSKVEVMEALSEVTTMFSKTKTCLS